MPDQNAINQKLSLKLCAAALVMFGFGFGLVPLYDVMCDALGINGKTNSESVAQPQGMIADTSRTITVEFMVHNNKGVPWKFTPSQTTMEVHPGEVIHTSYYARNLSQRQIVGQAVPSVSPGEAASYFNKIECFCFSQQPLEAKQDVKMPLIFYIEPTIPSTIHTLTLSYTLYDITKDVDTTKTANLSPIDLGSSVEGVTQ